MVQVDVSDKWAGLQQALLVGSVSRITYLGSYYFGVFWMTLNSQDLLLYTGELFLQVQKPLCLLAQQTEVLKGL
jgi:hypothetical protein